MSDWAEDFPAEGDVFIAGGIHRGEIDQELRTGAPAWWGHYQVVEMSSELVVGGAGYHGAPAGGEVEIGYGIVASRRGRGYATEAVGMLVSLALSRSEELVVTASTDADNMASQRVLQKAGFRLVNQDGSYRYRRERQLPEDA